LSGALSDALEKELLEVGGRADVERALHGQDEDALLRNENLSAKRWIALHGGPPLLRNDRTWPAEV
jgi:L-ascorbate metabolism protein UlaG (beta-lactamase superfamily)